MKVPAENSAKKIKTQYKNKKPGKTLAFFIIN